MESVEWLLNRNEGVDVLHPDPNESCNTDDAEDRMRVDAATGQAMLESGVAVLCQHCGEAPNLNTRGSAP